MLLRQLLERLLVLGVDFRSRRCHSCLPIRCGHGRDCHRGTVRRDLDGIFGVYLKEIENGTVDDQRPTVTVTNKILDHW